MRIICGVLSDVLLYMAFEYTDYSKAFCLFFTNTLMIPFLAKCMLKEPLKVVDIFALVVGFTGMILMIQPYKAFITTS